MKTGIHIEDSRKIQCHIFFLSVYNQCDSKKNGTCFNSFLGKSIEFSIDIIVF
jgi:hypothetical protein